MSELRHHLARGYLVHARARGGGAAASVPGAVRAKQRLEGAVLPNPAVHRHEDRLVRRGRLRRERAQAQPLPNTSIRRVAYIQMRVDLAMSHWMVRERWGRSSGYGCRVQNGSPGPWER